MACHEVGECEEHIRAGDLLLDVVENLIALFPGDVVIIPSSYWGAWLWDGVGVMEECCRVLRTRSNGMVIVFHVSSHLPIASVAGAYLFHQSEHAGLRLAFPEECL